MWGEARKKARGNILFVRAIFTVFRCPSVLHGRASEGLSADINKSLLFAFVRSKSLVIVGFGVDGCRLRENGAGCCHCSLAFSPRSSPLVLFTTYRDFSLQIIGVATTTASSYYIYSNTSERNSFKIDEMML